MVPGLYSDELIGAITNSLLKIEEDDRVHVRDFIKIPVIWMTIGNILKS